MIQEYKVALFTADPVLAKSYYGSYEMDVQVEVSGGGYARQPVTFQLVRTGDGYMARNAESVIFPEATASWGGITHMAIFLEGNRGFCTPLSEPSQVLSGETVEIRPGELALLIPLETCNCCKKAPGHSA
ncbi:hypothetical protein GTO89_12495 [Heliobacterium gestii]|uniref:Uncharacterized protein n=1 Tax=Heliomicrobium gestii TaxID=2699 RepID=A0A845LLW2_HELGE|nr:hypothetical protein [Heliomicrobium gestii]MBM7867302.1 hypothetical protein [Heliomicrobium gestii]MZP43856.1 hypothetical protein [Heliomicrobium gestii]